MALRPTALVRMILLTAMTTGIRCEQAPGGLRVVQLWESLGRVNQAAGLVCFRGRVLIPLEHGGVRCIDLETGRQVFEFQTETPLAFPPAVDDRGIYISTGIGAKSILMADGTPGDIFKLGKPRVMVLSYTGALLATCSLPRGCFLGYPPLPLHEGVLVTGRDSIRVLDRRGSCRAALRRKEWGVAQQQIADDEDKVLVVWRRQGGAAAYRTELWCFSVGRRRVLWKQPTVDAPSFQPEQIIARGSRVYASGDDDRISVLDLKTGHLIGGGHMRGWLLGRELTPQGLLFLDGSGARERVEIVALRTDDTYAWTLNVEETSHLYHLYVGSEHIYLLPVPEPWDVGPKRVTSVQTRSGNVAFTFTFEAAAQVFTPVEFGDYVCLSCPAGMVLMRRNSGNLLWRGDYRPLIPVAAEWPYLVVHEAERCLGLKVVPT